MVIHSPLLHIVYIPAFVPIMQSNIGIFSEKIGFLFFF